MRGLLDDGGALSLFAAVAYSVAVSTGIFVFWSYLLRLLPAMRTAATRLWLTLAMVIGSCAIVAMSSWLNAAALAGFAAVEQHLAKTVQDYQASLERAHEVTLRGQALGLDVGRTRQGFEDLSEQEAGGGLSGLAGRGAVFRVLIQKSDELAALEDLIAAQETPVAAAFAEGNAILSRMRALTSLLTVLGQRAETLQAAALEILTLKPPSDVVYTPVSTADAVILYARNFAPSWAGAIAIDLLPAVLVMIVAVAQAAIRAGRDPAETESAMTVAELRTAVLALRAMNLTETSEPSNQPVSDREGEQKSAESHRMRDAAK